MQKSAELLYDHGHQVIRLPDDIRLSSDHQTALQDEPTGDLILSRSSEVKHPGDFEKLFQMLDELGPAPENFMLFLCDPLLEREPQDLFGDEEDYL